MPELPEVESFRLLSEKTHNRKIARVFAPDSWYIKGGSRPIDLATALEGDSIFASRRRGKLLLLDTKTGLTLGLHFGMTGRLQVDDILGVDQLRYGTNKVNPEWQRFGLFFDDGGSLFVHDPRRLGGVELNPDEDRLGPDAMAITQRKLREVVKSSSMPVKARLMDQEKIAGIGNLMADEILWRAGLDPARPSRSLNASEVEKLYRVIAKTIPELIKRGGCHMGDVIEHRVEGGRCPQDGAILIRTTVGGRTTWYCGKHQH